MPEPWRRDNEHDTLSPHLKLASFYSAVLALATTSLTGCSGEARVTYEDSQKSANNTLSRNLSFPPRRDLFPSDAELASHLKDLQRKLLSHDLFAFRFKSDLDVHSRGGNRQAPPQVVIDALSEAFPHDSDSLNDKTGVLQAECVPGYRTNSGGTICIGEEAWVLYNKSTATYFLLMNPSPADPPEQSAEQQPVTPW